MVVEQIHREDALPPERAVLAGTVETAVNALWDAPPLIISAPSTATLADKYSTTQC